MRQILILVLAVITETSQAQLFRVSVNDLENIQVDEKQKIFSLFINDDECVYVTSARTDSLLLNMINNYRQAQDTTLKRLTYSIRLDTLSRLVAETIGNSGKLAHYPAFPELRFVADLLNIENIAYNASSEGFNRTSFSENKPSSDVVDLHKILSGWIQSPGHNRNMRANIEVGATKVMLRITKRNSSFFIETIVLLEADHSYSKRELDEKFKHVNEELVKRPIRIAPKRN